MKLMKLRIACSVLMASWVLAFPSLGAMPGYPTPRYPQIKRPITVKDMLPNVRRLLSDDPSCILDKAAGAVRGGFKAGEKILIVKDYSADPLVVEAFTQGAKELVGPRGKVESITIQGQSDAREPWQVLDEMFTKNYWPPWVWDVAKKEYDRVLNFAFIAQVHVLPLIKDWPKEKPFGGVNYATQDMMVSNYVCYPREIVDAIGAAVWRDLNGAKIIHVTDPEGTDLTMHFDEAYWKVRNGQKLGSEGGEATTLPYNPYHVTLIPLSGHVEGTLAFSAVHGGWIPKARALIKDGRAIQLEGGGDTGANFRKRFEEMKKVQYPGLPGPGIDWVEEISLGGHPKAFQDKDSETFSGTRRFFGYAEGRRRTGVLHIALGTSIGTGKTFDAQELEKKRNLPVHHRDTEIYFATYMADNKMIVNKGHLTALDDPQVRGIAAKYGNPDELLREDWVPAIQGVNVD